MDIILNEKEYAERCLREHSVGENAWTTAQILAKYYYSNGLRRTRIIKALTDFISDAYPPYQRDKKRWEENIEYLSGNAGKYELYQQNAVPITQSELDIISSYGTQRTQQQVLFTYLCLAKLALMRNKNANGWVNVKTRDVFHMAHVSMSTMNQDIMINGFYRSGLVDLPMKNDNLAVRVTFCDMDGDPVLYVSDFRDLGYLYLMQIGENIVACAECGTLIRGNKGGTKKYCSNCAGYVPKEYKIITCIDCGKEFRIDGNNKRTCRCENCQDEYSRELARLRQQKHRAK